jgi:Ger(x)C family germination protein
MLKAIVPRLEAVTVTSKGRWTLVFLFLSMFIFCGCWDRTEIDERAFVVGVAVDLAEATETNGSKPPSPQHFPFIEKEAGDTSLTYTHKQISYLMTVELAVLHALSAGPSDGNKEGTGDPSWVIGATAPTIQAASTAINLRVYRPLFFGHQQVLIIGEEAARENLRPILDFFTRHTRTKRKMRIAIAQGKASDILSIKPRLEALASVYLFRLFQSAPQHSLGLDADLNQAIVSLHSSGHAVISRVRRSLDGQEAYNGGAAVIKDWSLVGWLEDIETQGYLLAKGVSSSGRVSIPVATRPSALIEYVYHHCRTKTNARIEDGKLSFEIELCLEGFITEETAAADLTTEFIGWVEEALSEEITRRVHMALHKLQKTYGVDALELGRHLEISDPKLWERIKGDWPQLYPTVPIRIDTTARIRRTGSTK